MNHLQKCTGPDYVSTMEEYIKTNNIIIGSDGNVDVNQKDLKLYFASNQMELNAYTWLKWIVMRNIPISEMDNPLTRNESLVVQGLRIY